MFSKTSGQLLREHTRNPRLLKLHPHTRHREMFMRQHCCARKPQTHLDLSPCAKRHVPAKRHCCVLTPRAHLDLAACAKRHVSSKRLLRSHAGSTLGSQSVRKQEDMFMQQAAAFARQEHTWISLRAQKDMFRQSDCCVLTQRAHLVPYAIGNP